MITIRQKIVNELKQRLAAITIANEYQTDLGLGLILEFPIAFQDDELPALGIFDLINVTRKEHADEKRIVNELAIQVRIFLQRDTTPASVRTMLADVMRAVVSDADTGERDYTLGKIAIDMLPDEDGFIVPNETFQVDGASVGFTVQFLSQPFNAYE